MSIPVRNPHELRGFTEDLRRYLESISPPEPSELAELRQRTAALPFVAVMQGSRSVGELLQFLIRLTDARQVLEIGVFTGCTTLAMALALPADGRVLAIDVDEKWTEVGREFWTRSGCADRIDLRIGAADDVLSELIRAGRVATFDLAFIDANKDGYESYFEQCLVLLRDNGLMVFDNVLFRGMVATTESADEQNQPPRPKFLQDLYGKFVDGLRRFNQHIVRDPRVDIVVLPMIDGVTLVRKKAGAASSAANGGEER